MPVPTVPSTQMVRPLDVALAAFLATGLIIGLLWAQRNGAWSKFKRNPAMLGLMVLVSASIVAEFGVELAKGLGVLR